MKDHPAITKVGDSIEEVVNGRLHRYGFYLDEQGIRHDFDEWLDL